MKMISVEELPKLVSEAETIVHVPTKQICKAIGDELYDAGFAYYDAARTKSMCSFMRKHGDETCFRLRKGQFGYASLDWYKERNYTIYCIESACVVTAPPFDELF